MSFDTLTSDLKFIQVKKLRTALAVLQGAKLLSVLQQEAESTISHDQTKRVTYLMSLFTRIHRDLFHHWKDQATVNHRPGVMIDPLKRQAFRKTIARLVLDDDKNEDTAIFDNNGFVIQTDNIAERLARFYLKMRSVRGFLYGNRISLDFFMTILGKLPAFKAVYEQGIDFRRVDAIDAVNLHDLESSLEDVIRAFDHALDPVQSNCLKNKPNGYGKWPENKRFVSGIPFLSHTTDKGVECLVSVNGGLVPLETIKEELFMAGKHLADYPLSATENVIGYLPGTEALRHPEKKDIDGVPIFENGAAPLFCLDINMMTGLRTPSHLELLDLLIECGRHKNKLFELGNNQALKKRLLTAAASDLRLVRSVEIAHARLSELNSRLETAKEMVFAGKMPSNQPKLFMCLGGAGSGKTAVEEIAKAQCGDNFVIASLDEFRKESDLYKVLTAANHHSDDYVYVEPFANRLRDLVALEAKQKGINLLYDGTGIPFSPRYSEIVAQFKSAGFQTHITGVDAFIVKPKGREGELSRSGVIESVKDRYDKSGRALPWVITVYKHIRAPESLLEALQDLKLDKISLFANDGAMDHHYLFAESFDIDSHELKVWQDKQKTGDLAGYFKELIYQRNDSVLRGMAENNADRISQLLARNPCYDEENVAYQVYGNEAGYRALAIYNTRRMVDFVEKRQLNSNASGQEGLLHKPDALAFHVDPLAKAPWMITLQGG